MYADVSPGLALFLGMIPGVGAIYNGQYAKGMVHAIIWGVLMSIADSRAAHGLEPVFVMTVVATFLSRVARSACMPSLPGTKYGEDSFSSKVAEVKAAIARAVTVVGRRRPRCGRLPFRDRRRKREQCPAAR